MVSHRFTDAFHLHVVFIQHSEKRTARVLQECNGRYEASMVNFFVVFGSCRYQDEEYCCACYEVIKKRKVCLGPVSAEIQQIEVP